MCQCANVPNEKEIGTNSLNAEEKSPTFPKEIYDNLPNILSKVVSMARGEDDADLLLLGSLTTLSSCLPNIYGNSYNRRKDREFVELETPRMSAVLSGTPRQIKSLVPDTENGLFSRFMFYYMNVRLVWKDVFASADGEPAGEFFSDLGQEYFTLYRALEEQNRWLRFSLQPSQQQQFNDYFEGIQKEYTEMLGLDILASVRRLGLITYRIAMILTALRLQETGNFSDVLVCDDRDFETALSISKVLIKHTEKVYKTLEVSDSTNMKKNIQTQKKLMKSIFFEKLPVTFSRQDYITIAADLGIHERTSTRYVNEFILLERICKIGHGTFKKT
jgi:hypothetical protein